MSERARVSRRAVHAEAASLHVVLGTVCDHASDVI